MVVPSSRHWNIDRFLSRHFEHVDHARKKKATILGEKRAQRERQENASRAGTSRSFAAPIASNIELVCRSSYAEVVQSEKRKKKNPVKRAYGVNHVERVV